MIFTLFYLSRSTLRLPQQAAEIDSIVSFSRRFNQMAGIGGALMFTEQNFAQFLEGPQAEVEALMRSIRRDPRHTDIDLVFQEQAAMRRFPGWSMAYSGPHLFVERQFTAWSSADTQMERRRAADAMIDLMAGFTGGRPIEH